MYSNFSSKFKMVSKYVNNLNEKKIKMDCKKLSLKLNDEKTKTLKIGDKLQSEKFLGFTINNRINADSEVEPFLNNMTKITNTTRACTTLSKCDRMKIC